MATQVEILMRTEGGPDTATGGKPKEEMSDDEKAALEKEQKNFNNKLGGLNKFVKQNLGLQFSMSAVLKQSQIFTSFVGTIFQLLGALVDVMLAPLLPIAMVILRLMGRILPWVQTKSEAFGAWLTEAVKNVTVWYQSIKPKVDKIWAEFKAAWGEGWVEVSKLIGGYWWEGIKWGWDKLINNGLPWVWEQIKGLGGTIWAGLQTTAGRIFGFFMQGYVLIGGLRALTNRFLKWALSFGARLFGTSLAGITKTLLLLPFKIIGLSWKIFSFLIKAFMPVLGSILVGIVNGFATIIKNIPRLIFQGLDKLVKMLFGRSISVFTRFFMTAARREAKSLLGTLLKKISESLMGMKLFGGAFKKLNEGLGFLKTAAKASKAIPVLGAVATVGFGAVETYKNYKKYGYDAAAATVGKTALAAGVAMIPLPGATAASLAIDMGGSFAIHKAAKAGVFGAATPTAMKTDKPIIEIKQTIVAESGETIQEEIIQKLDEDRNNVTTMSAKLMATI